MKKFLLALITGLCIIATPVTAMADTGSLDDLINEPTTSAETDNKNETDDKDNTFSDDGVNFNNGALNDTKDAANLSETSEAAQKFNKTVKKVASIIVQILSYAITALLTVRVLLDLVYICIPFTRSVLSNGYGGNAQAGAGNMAPGMGQPGMMGGMGMGGMGMGGYGGRYGGHYGGMGMGGMGMGMGGMGMGMQSQNTMSQPGANPAMGRIQWVSTAALNACAGETVVGPNGKAVSPLKVYAKDMVIMLVLTPILLVLALTGVIQNLGFLLGELIARAIYSIGSMF